MKIMHHIGVRLEDEEERAKFLNIGVALEAGVTMPGGGIVTGVDIAEDDPNWQRLTALLSTRRNVDLVYPTFSPAELDDANFLRMWAPSPRGYPQPEDKKGYLSATYDLADYCPRCGIGRRQSGPFRFKSKPTLKDNSILQLNWIHDEYFVKRNSWEAVFKPLGIGMRPAVVHKTGVEIASIVQLDIKEVCDLSLDKGVSKKECSSCGRKKYSAIFRGFLPEPKDPAQPIFRSSQWFGSDALAFKLVIVSAALRRKIKEISFTGVAFHACMG